MPMDKNFDALKLSNQLCFPLYVCSKEIVKKYKPFLDEIGLTYTQYITMMAMWEREELSVKELGELLFLDSGTLTPVLKTLEKKGLVSRRRSSEDERVLVVTLTEDGASLKERAVEVPYKMQGCASIDEKDAADLYRILHKMMNDAGR
jgi:MarR family transcriptional regulator, organic hydroperoxide resistance regulator